MDDQDSPTLQADPGPDAPENWVSAAETRRIVHTATLDRYGHIAVLKRANAGLIRTRAGLAEFGEQTRTDLELPKDFWWAAGGVGLEENWTVGDFSTVIDRKLAKVFGVNFHRAGLQQMVPIAFDIAPPVSAETAPKESGGRRMSPLWPEWIAELAGYMYENGPPAGRGNQGADELINAIADGLAARGLEGPSRSTVQDTVKAVLRRVRGAGN